MKGHRETNYRSEHGYSHTVIMVLEGSKGPGE